METALLTKVGEGNNVADINDDGTRIIFASMGWSSVNTVRIFEYSDSNDTWSQMGSNIGSWRNNYGCSLDGSGNRALVSGGASSDRVGYVYDWNESNSSWDLYSNSSGESNFAEGAGGWNIDDTEFMVSWGTNSTISQDGNVIAFGQTLWGIGTGNPGWTGRVTIFSYNENTDVWSQMGDDISGEKMWGERDGQGITLNNDGTVITISTPQSDTDWTVDSNQNQTNEGQLRVFGFNGTSWVQVGSDIEGETTATTIGTRIASNGTGTRHITSLENGTTGAVKIFRGPSFNTS